MSFVTIVITAGLMIGEVAAQSLSDEKALPVYPGAEGFGTLTKAGRGGKILKVSNLKESGPGSLREALSADGARIVVFEVGGIIELSSAIVIDNPFVTIAGQTAPSPGITLKGAGLTIRTHDVLLQHIRIRVGDLDNGVNPLDRDGLMIHGPSSYNVVIDHISVSWAIDENASTWKPVSDITISNSIFSEGLYNSLHPKGPHSMGFLVGSNAKNIYMRGNLFTHNVERNPRISGNTSVVLVNNLMYRPGNTTFVYIGSPAGPSIVSLVGNVFINSQRKFIGSNSIVVGNIASQGTKVYLSDNRSTDSLFTYSTSYDPRVLMPPIWLSPQSIAASAVVKTLVLANAGARPADRDPVDQRIIQEVKTRAGRIIDSQEQVGGWPSQKMVFRPFVLPADPHGDDDSDGYTNIEDLLHKLAMNLETKIKAR